MNIGLSTLSFKGVQGEQPLQAGQIKDYNTVSDIKESKDAFLKTEEVEPKEVSLTERFANVWKFFSTVKQMVGSVAKGIVYGVASTGAVLAGFWTFGALPRALKKEGPKIMDTIRHPIKHISKTGKVLSAIAGVGVFAYNFITGKLEANQKTAVIDHKLKVGHRDE